jgi:hypothetical protein
MTDVAALTEPVICPDCKGERRIKGALCRRCNGTAQIRRCELLTTESAPFETEDQAAEAMDNGRSTGGKAYGIGSAGRAFAASVSRLATAMEARPMPRCMMPDGGECCPEYDSLSTENQQFRNLLEAAKEENQRLRVMIDSAKADRSHG